MLIQYEFPFNERVRIMLRLEDLAARFAFFQEQGLPAHHQAALGILFEIMEVAGRADLKSELLQELERQKQVLVLQREHADLSAETQQTLEYQINLIELRYQTLARSSGRTGQHIRENEWLMGLRTRMIIPGGACQFDVPSFHAWLHKPVEERQADLSTWTEPFYPLLQAISIVMGLLRERGQTTQEVAQRGYYQQMLGGKQYLMARVNVERHYASIPEVSANKYAISVRFLVQDGTSLRPRAHEADIPFELTLSAF